MLVQPAEEGLGGGDAPRQGLGAARDGAFLFHPLEEAVEIVGGDRAQGDVGRKKLRQQAHIRKEGLNGVGGTSLVVQEHFPGFEGWGQVGLQV